METDVRWQHCKNIGTGCFAGQVRSCWGFYRKVSSFYIFSKERITRKDTLIVLYTNIYKDFLVRKLKQANDLPLMVFWSQEIVHELNFSTLLPEFGTLSGVS
jgi:hypothetical protein